MKDSNLVGRDFQRDFGVLFHIVVAGDRVVIHCMIAQCNGLFTRPISEPDFAVS